MKILKTVGIVLLACAMHGYGQITVAVDMDNVTPGIQSTRTGSPGTFTADLIMTVGAGGVSSYGISALFDNVELTLNGSLVVTDSNSAAKEALPPGFTFNITPGVSDESNTTTTPVAMPGKGHVYTFEAATFGTGPSSTSFSIGTIAFSIPSVLNDGFTDIDLGFFNTGIDGAFDNAGLPVTPTFVSGSVVPEPGSAALLAFGAVSLLVMKLRRRAH